VALQGVSKGGMVEAILTAAARTGAAPDFVLCIGDDRSDEDMFTAMEHVTFSPHLPAEVRACADRGFLALRLRCRTPCFSWLGQVCKHTCAAGVLSQGPQLHETRMSCCRCLRAQSGRSRPRRPSTSTTQCVVTHLTLAYNATAAEESQSAFA
jgi:Trehalose-phosphatase